MITKRIRIFNFVRSRVTDTKSAHRVKLTNKEHNHCGEIKFRNNQMQNWSTRRFGHHISLGALITTQLDSVTIPTNIIRSCQEQEQQ
eukprot:677953-Hanusia_phi.AAC.2